MNAISTQSKLQEHAHSVLLGCIENGYELVAAPAAHLGRPGWVAAVRLIDDADTDYVARIGPASAVRLYPGKTLHAWTEEVLRVKRRVLWWSGDTAGSVAPRELTAAERISGLAATGPQPAVAWCERSDNRWHLRTHTANRTATVAESEHLITAPALAWIDGSLMLACEEIASGIDNVVLRHVEGSHVATVPGRSPQLLCDVTGGGILLVHRALSPDHFVIELYRISNGRLGRRVAVPPVDDYNLMAHAAFDDTDGALYLVHETCPSWGYDEMLGGYRELAVWRWQCGAESPTPAPGTARGLLPLPRLAFWDVSRHNLTCMQPKILVHRGSAVVTYRQFRYEGQKGFRWDLCTTRMVDGQWSDPARVPIPPGLMDPAYALLPVPAADATSEDTAEVIVIAPCCDGYPAVDVDNKVTGQDGITQRLRVEAHRFSANTVAPATPIPPPLLEAYVKPPSAKGACPPPPLLTKAPAGLRLVWADLHVHSSCSKCMSDQDGTPANVFSMQRDVQGCEVLCLTDHAEHLTCPEYMHVYDELERQAAGLLPILYGIEPWSEPAHNINYYTIDRVVFDRLRQIVRADIDERTRLKMVCDELPKGSVIAMRHSHGVFCGGFAADSAKTLDLFDPRLEAGMEAMQTRGNMMVGRWQRNDPPGGPLFPNNYLNRGVDIALVGGSDHSHGLGPNHFCLTGFWVTELTGSAVWEALRKRRTIASSNGKVAIWVELNGQPMGGATGTSGSVRITAYLSSARPVRRAYLIRDGEPLAAQNVDACEAAVELIDENPSPGSHWYVVTAEADSVFTVPGQRHPMRVLGKPVPIPGFMEPPVVAHASPIRVTVER